MILAFLQNAYTSSEEQARRNEAVLSYPDRAARHQALLREAIAADSDNFTYRILRSTFGPELKGLEHLFLTHGIKCKDRLHGITDEDAETYDPKHHEAPFDQEYWGRRGLQWRVEQIKQYIADWHPLYIEFVILDDLDLDCPELVCTAACKTSPGGVLVPHQIGLTKAHADEVIRRFCE